MLAFPLLSHLFPLCYDYTGKTLDSAVMTMRAKSSLSHGLIVRVVVGR
jgi:hypothetical protein